MPRTVLTMFLVLPVLGAASNFCNAFGESCQSQAAAGISGDAAAEEGSLLQLPYGASLQQKPVQATQLNSTHSTWPKACGLEPRTSQKTSLCKVARTKQPDIEFGFSNRPSLIEKDMKTEAKQQFEYNLALSLAKTNVVVETSKTFGKRLYKLIVEAGKRFDGLDEDAALVQAFGPKCSVQNTGFAGTEPSIIRAILVNDGNIREIWCLVYCLSKNAAVFNQVFARSNQGFFISIFGLGSGRRAWREVKKRRKLVLETKNLTINQYAWGVPDYLFPPMDNWVRFDFDVSLPVEDGGDLLWKGARKGKSTGCEETTLMSNDPKIYPPLSPREIQAECAAPETAPCKLKWYPGQGCFDLVSDNIYSQRAKRLGYHRVAAVSGTVANVLQLVLLMGYTLNDLLAFRTTMLAWLVSSYDHSFVEVMLAAEGFMPSKFAMQLGLRLSDKGIEDFARIWPKGTFLKVSWGSTFTSIELWQVVLSQVEEFKPFAQMLN